MNEPIRILHISGAMNRGGQETLIMELYRHIDRSKIQFDFFIYNFSNQPGEYDEEIIKLGGRIYEAKNRFSKNPIRFLAELSTFLKAHPEYKILHSHQYTLSGFILLMGKKCGRITIAHSHAIFYPSKALLRKIIDWGGRVLLRKKADYFFGCSELALNTLFNVTSANDNAWVLKNGVNVEAFRFSEHYREYWRSKIMADDNSLVIGYVARFSLVKNHFFLIDVFSTIVSNEPNAILVLVGDGVLKNEVINYAKKCRIIDNVIFLGIRSDVAEIINAFDVFVFPSISEGLGLVAIEAQTNGLPCILNKDGIPKDADIGVNLCTRIGMTEPKEQWAKVCINHIPRMAPDQAVEAAKSAGYDIREVAGWLQNFYLNIISNE